VCGYDHPRSNERPAGPHERDQPRVQVADDILRQAVQGISDLIVVPGLINLDFADVKAVMNGMGMALMGTGVPLADTAVEAASSHSSKLKKVRCRVLVACSSISPAARFAVARGQRASAIIHDAAHSDANIIFGAVLDESMKTK
jgi:cell division protein FtsZ